MRKRSRRRADSTQPPSLESRRRGGEGQRGDRSRDPTASDSARAWLRGNRSDIRFLLVFGVLMTLYYAATTTSFAKEEFFPWYLRATAQASGELLSVCGYDDMQVQGNVLSTPRGSVTVERGCDAIAPTALFVSAVLASPTLSLLKVPAVIGGTLVLMVLNVIRIMTLFLTRIHWPAAFDVMHLDVWQAMFIFLAIVLWALWASWATRRWTRRSDAAA